MRRDTENNPTHTFECVEDPLRERLSKRKPIGILVRSVLCSGLKPQNKYRRGSKNKHVPCTMHTVGMEGTTLNLTQAQNEGDASSNLVGRFDVAVRHKDSGCSRVCDVVCAMQQSFPFVGSARLCTTAACECFEAQ